MRLNTMIVLQEHYADNFNQDVKRYTRMLRCPYGAEDVVQEAYARAIKYIDTWKPDVQTFGQWINTIMHNACKDYRKDQRNQGMVRSEERQVNVEQLAAIEGRADEIIERIKAQPYPARGILEGFYLLGHTYKEIARYLDVNWHVIHDTLKRFVQEERERYEAGR